MSLNYEFSRIENWKEVVKQKTLTDTMIYATMFVGINFITEKNADEFYGRLHMLEKVNGHFLMKGGKGVEITLAEVRRYIGLSTNASTKTRKKFFSTQLFSVVDRFIKEAQ